MKLILIDSSSKKFSLAVSSDEKIICYRSFILDKLLSSSIIPATKNLLIKSALELEDIDGFAVGIGPGSFTSLRVGLSTIKALAFAQNKPIIGVPSLDLIALNVDIDECEICVVSDARRGLLYSCSYHKKGLALKHKTAYVLTDIDGLLGNLQKETVFVGDAVTMHHEQFKKHKLVSCISDEKLWYPKAKNILPLVYQKFKDKKFDDINRLVPLYLHPEDCQVKKRKT